MSRRITWPQLRSELCALLILLWFVGLPIVLAVDLVSRWLP